MTHHPYRPRPFIYPAGAFMLGGYRGSAGMGSWLSSFMKCGKTKCPKQEEITVEAISEQVAALLAAQGVTPAPAPGPLPAPAPVPAPGSVSPPLDISGFLSANRGLVVGGGLALAAVMLLRK